MSSTEAEEMELSYKGPNWEADLKRIAKTESGAITNCIRGRIGRETIGKKLRSSSRGP